MLPYSSSDLLNAIENPSLITREFRRLASRPVKNLSRNSIYSNNMGTDVMAQDWDNLIILDACRYDYFKRHNIFSEEPIPVISRGSSSYEFMEENFEGKSLHDTAYISANPHVGLLDENIFYTIDPLLDQWDRESATILPKTVVESTLKMHNKNPNKRLISHFMQPHQPYLGPTAERCKKEVNLRGMRPYSHAPRYEGQEINQDGVNWWRAVHQNKISRGELKKAYEETLEVVLEHAQHLVNQLDGKTIITSDHGELLGERVIPLGPRLYGHSHDIYPDELTVVPWLEIPSENRRTITHEEPTGFDRLGEETIENRLEALGYK